jgi:hypothetical protein
MCAQRKNWTDEVFSLFVEGRFGSLSARQVREAIDGISIRPALLERLNGTQGATRMERLVTLVFEVARRSPSSDACGEGDDASENDPS